MQMRNDIAKNRNIDMIGAHGLHDRSFSSVEIGTKHRPFLWREFIGAYHMPQVQDENAVATVGLVF